MTQDEIIELAKQAGASADGRLWLMYSEDLEAFAKLVEAKEREACALVADNFAMTSKYKTQRNLAEWCAWTIRSRGHL
jgi:hypothetical protein